jgi:hypothetical protein
VNGFIIEACAKLARFGASKAAAFCYAVLVGVAGNLVFNVLQHDPAPSAAAPPAVAAAPSADRPVDGGIATAVIAPIAPPAAPLPALAAPAAPLPPRPAPALAPTRPASLPAPPEAPPAARPRDRAGTPEAAAPATAPPATTPPPPVAAASEPPPVLGAAPAVVPALAGPGPGSGGLY